MGSITIVSDHDFYYNKKEQKYFVNRNEHIHLGIAKEYDCVYYLGRVYETDRNDLHELPENFNPINVFNGKSDKDWVKSYFRIKSIITEYLKKSDTVLLKLFTLNSLLASKICKKIKKKYYSYLIGDPSKYYSISGKIDYVRHIKCKILKSFTEYILRGSSKILYMSEQTISNYRFPSNIEIVKYIESSFSEGKFIERKINKDKIKLLFVGRLIKIKGIEGILETTKKLITDKELNIHLDIVGEGVNRQNLEQMISNLNIGDNVTLHGFVTHGEKLDNLYEQADILVNNSLTEAFGLVLIEASKSGLPIVAARVGGIPGVIPDKIAGLLHSDEDELYNNLLSLIESTEEYEKFNKGAFENAEKYSNSNELEILISALK